MCSGVSKPSFDVECSMFTQFRMDAGCLMLDAGRLQPESCNSLPIMNSDSCLPWPAIAGMATAADSSNMMLEVGSWELDAGKL